jgi:ABC-type phosphate transport system auxiliary subunit
MRTNFAAIFALLAALALSGCAPAYDQGTADSLREHVVTISEASAAGEWQIAITELDALGTEAAKAREAGKLESERFEKISLAMELVRQDLEAAIAAAEDDAERQRLQEEQARLQEQIDQLRNPGDGGGGGDEEGGNGGDKGKNEDKRGGKGKNEGKGGKD